MVQISYVLLSTFALLTFACNRENERAPATGTEADAEARGPSSSDALPADTSQNFDANTGGWSNRAGDVPGPVGGGGLGGTGGGIGRSANTGKEAAPSTIGSSP